VGREDFLYNNGGGEGGKAAPKCQCREERGNVLARSYHSKGKSGLKREGGVRLHGLKGRREDSEANLLCISLKHNKKEAEGGGTNDIKQVQLRTRSRMPSMAESSRYLQKKTNSTAEGRFGHPG